MKICIVKDCTNTDHPETGGEFVGDLCYPCHAYITTGDSPHSQAFRNAAVYRKWPGIIKIMEECAELITACAKLCACPDGTYWDGTDAVKEVQNEMSDVTATIRFFGTVNNVGVDYHRVQLKHERFLQWHSRGCMRGVSEQKENLCEHGFSKDWVDQYGTPFCDGCLAAGPPSV